VNYSGSITTVQNSTAAALDDQNDNHYVPNKLHQEKCEEFVSLKNIQSFGIQNSLQNVKVIEENEQERYGDDSQQRICEVLLDGLANIAEEIVDVGHLFDRVFRVEAYNGGNTVPLHRGAD